MPQRDPEQKQALGPQIDAVKAAIDKPRAARAAFWKGTRELPGDWRKVEAADVEFDDALSDLIDAAIAVGELREHKRECLICYRHPNIDSGAWVLCSIAKKYTALAESEAQR